MNILFTSNIWQQISQVIGVVCLLNEHGGSIQQFIFKGNKSQRFDDIA